MLQRSPFLVLGTLFVALLILDPSQTPAADPPSSSLGLFGAAQDIGTVLHAGATEFDAAKGTYTLAGSGENMWATADAFRFVYKQMSGDVDLSSNVSFLGAGTDPHRKAVLMIRQSLDADSDYVDVALHGEGLTSLQFRDAKGAATHEVQANVKGPTLLRLEKRGKYARMYLGEAGAKEARFSGAAVRIEFQEPFYVGLGVCAHNKDLVERAVFSNVSLRVPEPLPAGQKGKLYSTLETQALASTDRRVTFVTEGRIEAPNWLHDNSTLLYNGGGRIWRVPMAGGTPEAIDTGSATRCNNDHGVSPDGNTLVISDQSQTIDGKRPSLIYTLPITGGTPKRITMTGPSYWHGWSPDGKTLVFCGQRNGEFDVYTIPADGGEEKRLTTAKGLDDGPEFSPDGKQIYFNSDRTGLMQIWRISAADGSNQEQVTSDDSNNWFPHLSPDGKRMLFLTYDKDVKEHPEDKDVQLRILNLETKKIDVLAKLFGGQGTINVPCWSPDGKRIAFVTYQYVQ
jgi:TolB protein